MKSLVIVLALVVNGVKGDVSELGYDYHAPQPITSCLPQVPSNLYLPPAPIKQYLPPKSLMASRPNYIPPRPIKAPNTRPSNEYLPPVKPEQFICKPLAPKNTYLSTEIKHELIMAPRNTYIPPVPVTPKNTYIPPLSTPVNTYLPSDKSIAHRKHINTPPAPRLEDLVAPQPPQSYYEDSEAFTVDGYKTVRKHKF